MNNDNAMPKFCISVNADAVLKGTIINGIYMIVVTCKEVVPEKFTSMDTLFITLC